MPRLSMYRPNRTNDYNFFDRRIYEMFTVGGTDIFIHKYLGTFQESESNDATQPVYSTISEQNIQDLLFLENRDRKYERDVYSLRGIYNVQDIDFDLSQFGIFVQNDTIFISFHLNDMVNRLGRKILSGDVLELPHLKDFYGLNAGTAALKRFYVVKDAERSAEGYSQTWLPHVWRVKAVPLVDGQEYRDILDQIQTEDDDGGGSNGNVLRDLLSTYNQEISINDAVLTQAENETPYSGYDTSQYYTVATKSDGSPADPDGITTDNTNITTDNGMLTADIAAETPRASGYDGYLTGDGIPPNNKPLETGIEFPLDPNIGDYFLRLDYSPNRLFRYDGTRWVKMEDDVRSPLTPGPGQLNQKSGFVNNDASINNDDGTTTQSRQSLSDALRIELD